MRPLGRLAFVEHYSAIAGQLRKWLGEITQREALGAAVKQTNLTLRSEWPCIYVLANLAGGTGSGMFLDLAYLASHLLHDLGYDRRDVIGLFAVPVVTEVSGTELALANSYAALTELRHFLTPGVSFAASYESGHRFETSTLPMSRCRVITLPVDAGGQQAVLEQAVECLRRELVTPLGRAADNARGRAAREHATGLQVSSMRALVPPRDWLVHYGATRVCKLLLDRWLTPRAAGPDDHTKHDAAAVMQSLGLNPPRMVEQLRTAVAAGLGRAPESFFEEWLTPLRLAPMGLPTPDKVINVVQEADAFFGRRGSVSGIALPRALSLLRDGAEDILKQTGPALVRAILGFVDRAAYRLGGTEAILRQAIALVDTWVRDCAEELREQEAKLNHLSLALDVELDESERYLAGNRRGPAPRQASLSSGDRPGPSMSTPADRLFHFLSLRYQLVIWNRLRLTYVALRDWLPVHTKELLTCRQRLSELRETCQTSSATSGGLHAGMWVALLPRGCETLDETVAQMCAGMTADELEACDRKVQDALTPLYPSLATVCIKSPESLPEVINVMATEAQRYLDEQIKLPALAELFLERYPDFVSQSDASTALHEQAAPIPGERCEADEISIILVPTSSPGAPLVKVFQAALPETQVVAVEKADEIVLYREVVNLEWEALPQLGPIPRNYYQMAAALENFTPHSRADVTWK